MKAEYVISRLVHSITFYLEAVIHDEEVWGLNPDVAKRFGKASEAFGYAIRHGVNLYRVEPVPAPDRPPAG